MYWDGKSFVYKPHSTSPWMASHAQLPFVECVSSDRLRIYFGTRNLQNQTTTTFVDTEAKNPKNILYIHDRPVLPLGDIGCFDDNGVMPSWIISNNEERYLYYTGWNTGITIPFRNSIGLAISQDEGITYKRISKGPILDRNIFDPYFCGTPCVIIENNIWRMWYLSGIGWKTHNGKPEPYYNIKYAESQNGVDWKRDGHVCVDFKTDNEGGIARPSVLKDGNIYKMWYSYRGGSEYRTDHSQSYRIGYAESPDGLNWTRKDDQVGIDVSTSGWDSEMICYPFVLDINHRRYMFYNGNGFGKSGFGYAILDDHHKVAK
jgi:hypothetical protein